MYSVVLAVILSLLPLSAMAKSIVVLGDSISAGYGIEVQRGWVALLQNKLADQHRNYVISNESISGDTSAGGLARLEQILTRHKPEILLLELGANDGLRGLSPQEMKNNLTEIVRRSQKAGAKVLLLGMKIPPNYGKRYVEMFYEIYPQLSTELKIPYVPFILEEVALKPELMQADGLHPNELAQPKVAEKIWRYLQPLI
ncbi:arylesterase [Methylomonas albis]|uniref:Arylesterase n=1 Tax=Methylomonas albis TaxID=1854563 RepID=A0ABR9D5E7_9GAMM|nr:arylesterase [Methylomonas albis]MBD9358352.1 arylesterase [Methylomonas albis]